MIQRIAYWLLFLLFAAYCIGYLGYIVVDSVKRQAARNGSPATRGRRAEKAAEAIKVGAAASWETPEGSAMWSALSLAANEINDAGGPAGRKILLVRKDDEGTPDGARRAAQQLADDPDIVAVIGHGDSDLTLAASLIYDHYGVLLLAPAASAMKLTHGGSLGVFRLPPGEDEIARTLADQCVAQGLKRVMIYYAANGYGLGLANAFEKLVDERGLAIPDRLSYDGAGGEEVFKSDLDNWKRYYRFDAILLAGGMPEAARIAALARERGIDAPILAGCELDSPALIEQAGAGAEGIIVASVFDAGNESEAARAFVEACKARHGAQPTWRAAHAYDALKLLAAAVEAEKSATPSSISGFIRSVDGWIGVTGRFKFSAEGDAIAKPVGLRQVKAGKFEPLTAPPPFVHPPAPAVPAASPAAAATP